MDEYTQGFIDKCASAGVDPEALMKEALSMGHLKMLAKLRKMPGLKQLAKFTDMWGGKINVGDKTKTVGRIAARKHRQLKGLGNLEAKAKDAINPSTAERLRKVKQYARGRTGGEAEVFSGKAKALEDTLMRPERLADLRKSLNRDYFAARRGAGIGRSNTYLGGTGLAGLGIYGAVKPRNTGDQRA